MVLCEVIRPVDNYENFDESFERILELIRKRCLGAIWVVPRNTRRDGVIKRIKEAAEYPILIITDAESGLGEHTIGRDNALEKWDIMLFVPRFWIW